MVRFRNVIRPVFDGIGALLQAAWGPGWGTYIQAYPPEEETRNLKAPIITYRVMEKGPGTLGSSGTYEIKPRVRETQIDPNDERHSLQIMGQRMNVKIRFGFWETSIERSWELAERFEEFMVLGVAVIKEEIPQVYDLIFDRMESGSPETNRWRVNYFATHADYKLAIEQNTVLRAQTLQKLRIVVRNIVTPYGEEALEDE